MCKATEELRVVDSGAQWSTRLVGPTTRTVVRRHDVKDFKELLWRSLCVKEREN